MAVAIAPNMDSQSLCLIVGDGNFTFSLSFALNNPRLKIICTSLDDRKKVLSSEQGKKTITKLDLLPNVTIIHNIDATRLQDYPEICNKKYNRIYFNFPHVGGKSNIKRNRELVAAFCASACQLLEASSGEIHITLCRGQGGTPTDHQRRYNDTWKVVELAAEANLKLVRVQPFNREQYTEYTSTGYRSQNKSFYNDGSLTHVFATHTTDECSCNSLSEVGGEAKLWSESCSFVVLCDAKLDRPLCVPLKEDSLMFSSVRLLQSTPIVKVLEEVLCPLYSQLGLVPLCEVWTSSGLNAHSVIFAGEKVQQDKEDCGNVISVPINGHQVKIALAQSVGPVLRKAFQRILSTQSRSKETLPSGAGVYSIVTEFKNTLPSIHLVSQRCTPIVTGTIPVSSYEQAMEKCLTFRDSLLKHLKCLPGPTENSFLFSDTSLCSSSLKGSLAWVTTEDSQSAEVEVIIHYNLVWIPEKECQGNPPLPSRYAIGFEFLIDSFPLLECSITRWDCSAMAESCQIASQYSHGPNVTSSPGLVKASKTAIFLHVSHHLTALALISYQIPDVRLLGCAREMAQLSDPTCTSFSPSILYPVKFTHDISYWIYTPQKQSIWTRDRFGSFLYDIDPTHILASVALEDHYISADEKSEGFCYRILYYSFNEIVSRSKAYQFQQMLRLTLRDKLQIILR